MGNLIRDPVCGMQVESESQEVDVRLGEGLVEHLRLTFVHYEG
jgi:hypothetical protein